MKALNMIGGLTRGRRITASTVAKWILSSIVLTEVSNEMEKYCNVSYDTSEQHVDSRMSRISRDAIDLQKLITFYNTYDPFSDTSAIMSIYSGLVGSEEINCYKAVSVGKTVMESFIRQTFDSMKSKKKTKYAHWDQLRQALS